METQLRFSFLSIMPSSTCNAVIITLYEMDEILILKMILFLMKDETNKSLTYVWSKCVL
jgi:hypothetical protein